MMKYTKAMCNLAINLEIGNGIKQNIKKANEFYEMASLLGHSDGIMNEK